MMHFQNQPREVPPHIDRPRDEHGRELISIKALLEWAFAVECASLDYDEVGESSGRGFASAGMEARIGEILQLNARVDTSFGRSLPHHDAEIVATVLRNSVSQFGHATWVAGLARAQAVPKWDLGMPRLRPADWADRGPLAGQRAKSEVLEVVSYRSPRRGVVRREVRWTPCVWIPSPAQIGAARRAYLLWWGILLEISAVLKTAQFERFSVTDHMPPMTPWKKT